MEEGSFTLELNDLSFFVPEEKEFNLRLDVELLKGGDKFEWKNVNGVKYSGSSFKPLARKNEELGGIDYLFGFESLSLKSNYFDLTPKALNELANTIISIKVMMPAEAGGAAAAAAADPKAKGKAPAAGAPAGPSEQPLIDVSIPFKSVLKIKGSNLELDQVFFQDLPNWGILFHSANPHLEGDKSFLNLRISSDNQLSEYGLGARSISWRNASLLSPPPTWALHYADVIDPKAKVPPTAAELRSKYIENIVRLVGEQSKVASFQFVVGGSSHPPSDEDSEESLNQQIQAYFPTLELGHGTIVFDKELAEEIPIEEDIRHRGDLWSINWSSSPAVTLQRSQVKKFVQLLKQDLSQAYLPVTIKKVPTAEAMAAEGGEVFATGVLDISSIITPNETSMTIPLHLQGDGFDHDSVSCSTAMELTLPLAETSPLQAMSSDPKVSAKQQEILKQKEESLKNQVTSNSTNDDILQDLRDEICKTIERIAQEYVSIYPSGLPSATGALGSPVNKSFSNDMIPPGSPSGSVHSGNPPGSPMMGNAANYDNADERRAKFITYMISNGIFHELQENLKLKIHLIIQDRYGKRGRALGKSAVLRKLDADGGNGITEDPNFITVDVSNEAFIQEILSELYVFLMQQVNIILNSLFTNTILQKQIATIENPALINDEVENYHMILSKLLSQGYDYFANEKFVLADECMLERLTYLDHHYYEMKNNLVYIHSVYIQYTQYLLTRYTQIVYIASSSSSSGIGNEVLQAVSEGENNTISMVTLGNAEEFLQKAREIVTLAYKYYPQDLPTIYLYCLILFEFEQYSLIEDILQTSIHFQLQDAQQKRAGKSSLQQGGLDVNALTDYESDELLYVPPKLYIFLANVFYVQKKSLLSYKALKLATRCFEDVEYDVSVPVDICMPIKGVPRRSLVYLLLDTSRFSLVNGGSKLSKNSFLMAKDCEFSAIEKAKSRNKPTSTPLSVQFLFKQLAVELSWTVSPVPDCSVEKNGMDVVQTCFQLAEGIEQRIQAKVIEGKVAMKLKLSTEQVLDAFLYAIKESMVSLPPSRTKELVPLDAILNTVKLLMFQNKFNEAISVILYGTQVYNSASLCLYLGILYYRLDKVHEAEDILLEGNLLNPRHADIWAYLCIVCITQGYARLSEAEDCLFQTLRLGQNDPNILREMATAFISMDKLQTAEDLIRRTIAIETATAAMNGSGKAVNPYTRKLLADVLAGQNLAAQAIDEYKNVLTDENVDITTKLSIAEKCTNLLVSLGREEELTALNNIITNLRIQQLQQQ